MDSVLRSVEEERKIYIYIVAPPELYIYISNHIYIYGIYMVAYIYIYEVRRLLLDLDPYGGTDPLGMFLLFL